MAVSRARAFALAVTLLVASVVTAAPPAQAVSFTILDPSGVDYDAACVPRNQRPGPPVANSYASPGGAGCPLPGVSTYHGSTEATDLREVSLASTANSELVASFKVDGAFTFAGNTNINALDTPLPGTFLGARWRVMFRNQTRQTNVPNNSAGGGCAHVGSGVVFDQHGSWKDGFHFFIGFALDWDGTRWVQSAQIGEYDPSPGGGFRVTELGSNDGAGWTAADPNMPHGSTWAVTQPGANTVTVTVDGLVRSASSVCSSGVLNTLYFAPGDTVSAVKGLSTVVRVPGPKQGAAPCSPSSDDECTASGPTFAEDDIVSDTTASNSTIGALGRNTPGIAYTNGEDDASDTQGPGSMCPTPTYGGTAPQNPFFVPNSACHQDDDAVGRGTSYGEFWD